MFCGVTKLRTNPSSKPLFISLLYSYSLQKMETVFPRDTSYRYHANSNVCFCFQTRHAICTPLSRCLWIANKDGHGLDWERQVEMVYFGATLVTKQLRSFGQHLFHPTTSRCSVKGTDTHKIGLCHNHTFRIRKAAVDSSLK